MIGPHVDAATNTIRILLVRAMRSQIVISLVVVAGLLAPASTTFAEPDQGRINDELREVFERPEFKPRANKSFQLPEFLRRFFQWLGNLRSTLPVLFWLLLIVCVALVVALLGYIGLATRRAAFVRRDGISEAHEEIRRRLSDNLRQEADRHARAGEYTASVRCLFLSLVYAFDESGRFLFQAALTNREYLREFAGRPNLQEGLRVFVDILDANWYGQLPTTVEQHRECLDLYDRLRTQA